MRGSVLATLSDQNYLDQAKQLFSSVYHNSGWQGDYLLLAYGIPEKDLDWFRSKGILVHDCEPLAEGPVGDWPPTVLSKFHLFQERFKEWENVLYLDADITVEASMDGMLGSGTFSAVNDVHDIPIRDQFMRANCEERIRRDLECEDDLDRLSFNAGVFTFSTRIIREGTFDDLVRLFERYRTILRFPEQAILNLYFSRSWYTLPPAYNNYHIYIKEPWSVRERPSDGIVNHFISLKPWIVKDEFYYPRWKLNLSRASSIDLDNRKPPTRIWSEEDILAKTTDINRMANITRSDRFGNALTSSLGRFLGGLGKIGRKISPRSVAKVKKMLHR